MNGQIQTAKDSIDVDGIRLYQRMRNLEERQHLYEIRLDEFEKLVKRLQKRKR